MLKVTADSARYVRSAVPMTNGHASWTNLSEAARRLLCCVTCRGSLALECEGLRCVDPECGDLFPVLEGVPVLIKGRSSLFSVDDLTRGERRASHDAGTGRRGNGWLGRLVPSSSLNVKASRNYERFASLLLEREASPIVLLVGGGVLGEGTEELLLQSSVETIESDVSFGPRTTLVCDAHDIPFESSSLDGVVLQAVLEHVVDPTRCVEEIHRVLKKGGIVFAETPFMQPVHAGRYDFTRFTHLGHRRLFKKFDEIDSGATCGPGMALAWSYEAFLQSFAEAPYLRLGLKAFARLTSFWLKYFDYYLISTPGGLDAASAFYFLGQKGENTLSDTELVGLYRGSQRDTTYGDGKSDV